MASLQVVTAQSSGYKATKSKEYRNELVNAQVIGIPGSDLFTVQILEGDTLDASRALSCIVEPKVNDQVLLYCGNGGDRFILAVLARESSCPAILNIAGHESMIIQSEMLTLRGHSQVDIQSRNEMNISCLETIRINAGNILETARQSLVQLATTHIAKSQNIAFNAKQLFRTHGHHQLISADADVKIDGERINMG